AATASAPTVVAPAATRRACRRVTPGGGVDGSTICACARSMESEAPLCSLQSNESMVAHVKTEIARAAFPRAIFSRLGCFMTFTPGLPHAEFSCERRGPSSSAAHGTCGRIVEPLNQEEVS